MKNSILVALIGAVMLASGAAKADGVQICVDAKGSRYKVDIKGFANEGTDWSGVIHSHPTDAIPNGTNLRSLYYTGKLADSTSTAIDDLSFSLKTAVAPQNLNEDFELASQVYADEPRVYESKGLDIICSSTMGNDEYNRIKN